MPISRENNLMLIEDCALSLGSSFNDDNILYEARIWPKIPFKYSSIAIKVIGCLYYYSKTFVILNQNNN